MAIETIKWDVAEHLDSDERVAGYLEAAFELGDLSLILAAINDVARARGITDIAEKTGLTRPALYKALGPNGNPRLSTFLAILKALGVRIGAQPVSDTVAVA